MSKTLKAETFHLGACYYPEQWDESLWEDDFRRMKEMGFSIIRVAEFAWSIFEPKEGQFSFELFDKALDLAHRHGIKVILGTPTATPPAWLTHKYPEVLNVSQDGVQYQHGQRRHYNYNAPIYLELSARIVRKMAEHYKNHPAVVGWQIDNELNCEINVFYSEADHKAFREWLKARYQTLEVLNEQWGTVFWNQTYTDWEQIHLTRPTVSDSPNPHQALDEKRFISDSAIRFARNQAEILREVTPNQWVTTNGVFGHLDTHKMTDELLDFISYDSYPQFSTIYPDKGTDPLLDRKWSQNLSVTRSISPNFCVMEQQSGPGGWVNRMEMPSPKPGQMRLWTYQSIAHGADMLLYFRWRTAAFGTEIYWHGINNYDNQRNRRVEEAERIGLELQKIGHKIVGSQYEAQIAIVKDYDNEWDGELDRWHGPLESKSTSAWFKALQRNHIPANLFFLSVETKVEDLLQYKLLVYPHPTILNEEASELLKDYVRQGGKIIFGCRSGYKNQSGHCYMTTMPGPVRELCGVSVEDFTFIGPNENTPTIDFKQHHVSADLFNDILRVESAHATVLATYKEAYYQGKPALVRNVYGSGEVYYFGSVFNEESAFALLKETGLSSPACDWLTLPRDIELAIRTNENTKESALFLLNYSSAPQSIAVQGKAYDLLSEQIVEGNVVVEPYGVMILKK